MSKAWTFRLMTSSAARNTNSSTASCACEFSIASTLPDLGGKVFEGS